MDSSETTSAERNLDETMKHFIATSRRELLDLLANDKEKGMSWIDIRGKRYLTVATLMKVLRDNFAHTLILKSEIKHDCEHRVIIEATLFHKRGFFLSSGLAERWKDPKSTNMQKSKAIECCQTAAWGRCIKSLFAVGNVVATADEIDRYNETDISKEIDKEVK